MHQKLYTNLTLQKPTVKKQTPQVNAGRVPVSVEVTTGQLFAATTTYKAKFR